MTKSLMKKLSNRMRLSPHSAIPFDEYMNICLYDAEEGYYQTDRVRIGKEGDFYTSSNLGSIMGEMIAAYIANEVGSLASASRPVQLTEWGSGTGRLALHVLDELRDRYPQLYERLTYSSIETSGSHRALQEEMLQEHADKWLSLDEEQWFARLDKLDDASVIVLSNELLDAMPVKRAKRCGGSWAEGYVGMDEGSGQLIEIWDEPTPELSVFLSQLPYFHWHEGQLIEVNLAARGWIKRIGERIPHQAMVITIDYGDLEEELYAEHRMNGTLMCYYRHRAHSDPFVNPGEQDMTAHVNFSELIRAGREAGLADWKLMTQKQFLLEAGILEKLEAHGSVDPFHPVARRNRFIRQLLLSDQMSELFKVLIQYKREGEAAAT